MKNLSFIGYDQYAACTSGKIYSIRSGKFLHQVVQKSGYCHVTLSQDGKKNNFLVHRLIALAYLAIDPERTTVNHIDGNKQNNALSNLEWMNHQEQAQHALVTGLRSGTRNPDRNLTDETVHKICQLLEDSWRNKDIATTLGVGPELVAKIRHGTTYSDISSQYDFTKAWTSRRKICTEKLIKICEMLESGNSYGDIARATGVSTATVSSIKHRKTGCYISKSFNF